MEFVGVFDIFKIGVGPSSSHTLGPWRAAEKFIQAWKSGCGDKEISRIQVDLFGSLAKTGLGHGTDLAILMGLSGKDPAATVSGELPLIKRQVQADGLLHLPGLPAVPFSIPNDLRFHRDETLPFHPNGVRFSATASDSAVFSRTYYSIGGGFVVEENAPLSQTKPIEVPVRFESADELAAHCHREKKTIAELALCNEVAFRSEAELDAGIERLVEVMKSSVYDGCHQEGLLPGGLLVKRRAMDMSLKLITSHRKLTSSEKDRAFHLSQEDWFATVGDQPGNFNRIVGWVSCFAMAVNEQNASYGRVVTAPTNGAAGVIPAVLLYAEYFAHSPASGKRKPKRQLQRDFLLTAAVVGALFKKGATISAAMGGCQAEIGVSSAMAAAALAAEIGGSPDHALMAAEIAMEHHLGLTCDPIGGLVQAPCIERNTMGAIKAITAAQIAVVSDPKSAKVSLDQVIETMWQTALDMSAKYKETSEGGLAVQVPLSLAEC